MPRAPVRGSVTIHVGPTGPFLWRFARPSTMTGAALAQAELVEIQEACAVQVKGDLKPMAVGSEDWHHVSVNGSGISLVGPIAGTGTRVLVSIRYEMRRPGVRCSPACICGGRELAAAAVFENT